MLFNHISDRNRSWYVFLNVDSFLAQNLFFFSLGSYMFYNVVNRSYFTMFSINASILVVAILYSILHLKV